VVYRAVLWYLKTPYKLTLPHSTEGGADQAASSERQKEKKLKPYPGKTTTELLLKFQHQVWMLEA
jgi:hypothetical protein